MIPAGRVPLRPAGTSFRIVLAAGLIGTAYVLIFWRRLLLFGQVPIDGDMMRLVYPAWSIGQRLFAEQWLPLWDPFRNMGCAFLAHPPNQAVYPLHRLIPVSSFLDYMRLYVLAHLLVAAAPAYLLARARGGSVSGGALAAIGVAFNGFVLARVTTTIDFAAYAWAPLALYTLERRRPAALGLVMAVQWLAGFPTFSLMTGGLLIMFALASSDVRGGLRCLAVAAGVALAVAAVQWIPFLDLLARSARPVFLDGESAEAFSVPWKDLVLPLTVPSPVLNRMEFSPAGDPAVTGFYLGPVIAGLAFEGARDRRSRPALVVAIGCLALALGSALPFYGAIPGITLFRFPAHWLFPATILLVFLAASGVDRLRSAGWRAILVTVVALDFLAYAWPARSAWGEAAALETVPARTSMLGPGLPEGRVFFEPSLLETSGRWWLVRMSDWERLIRIGLPSIPAGFGVREVVSRHQLTSASHVEFVNRLAASSPESPAFDMAGVSTIIRLTRPAADIPAPEDFTVFANPNFDGPAFMADGGGPVRVIGSDAGLLKVEAEGPGRLVLSESYDPGWRAFVDGRAVAVRPHEQAFPSAEVPAGRHTVLFSYRPWTVSAGSAITLAALAALAALGSRRLRRRARKS